jgi:uncharacterized OsmC-like protein
MNITAQVVNRKASYEVLLKTGEREHSLTIETKPDGFGSSLNGGELLFLALATCYCNDIYREARKRDLKIDGVDVEVAGEFGGDGEPAQNIRYRATVLSQELSAKLFELMTCTDSVAEIHNTLRKPNEIVLTQCEVHGA